MDLKERLRRLYGDSSREQGMPDDSLTRARRGMHHFVQGSYVPTPWGDIFVGEVRLGKDHACGKVRIRNIHSVSDEWLSRWGHFPSRRTFDHTGTIFVDTETSGLAGAGGTLPFLIGIGYFYGREFRIEQFFSDTHAREEGMLDLVAEFVKPFHTVVTFNGKTFDMPLLETRYLLKRKRSPFSRMDHLDLLHPCRQLWQLSLDNCKLQTLERDVLGFERADDLPGAEVPQAYFKYVRLGDPDPLYRVFGHNADDITALVAMTYLLWAETRGDGTRGDPVLDFSRGKIFGWHGETKLAIQALESARKKETSAHRLAVISSRLSMLYKSLGRWRDAETLWMEMVEGPMPFHLLPYVELAKYYEHRTGDLDRARDLVERALSEISSYRHEDVAALRHRLNRVIRKIEKRETSPS
ncbi:MAG: ribonuclease H-like domain-containing protein [Fidelibacterota bacterium]